MGKRCVCWSGWLLSCHFQYDAILSALTQWNWDMSIDDNKTSSTGSSESEAKSFAPLLVPGALLSLQPCCRQTVRSHVTHNPMMACPDCKIMIKCFSDEKSFNNYVTFCRSRGRRVKTASDSGFYFAMYNTYPMSIGSGS
jgi:hypothetical protein